MKATMLIFIPLLLMINSSAGIFILDLLANYGLQQSYNIKTEQLPRFAEYDFIVVGSGAGGSPVANRLSENKNWRILLLEAGKPEGILNQVPMIFAITPENDWQYASEPQSKACLSLRGQRCSYTKGRSLGGSTTLNGMAYSRGHKLDFDLWAENGNYGWTYDEVLPYFKKSERAKLRKPVDEAYHGKSGHVHVQSARWHTSIATAFVQSGPELGHDIVDYNGKNMVGFSHIQATVVDGARCSASKAYLRIKRPNLDIVTNAKVSKILIDDNNRAYGVEFTQSNRSHRVTASKEVILSAGAINTPQLLMLSGIGPSEHLNDLGIKVLKDAKVGYNLNDHVAFAGLVFLVNQSVTLMEKNLRTSKNAVQYALKGDGPYSAVGGNEAVAFVRTKHATDARPDIELVFHAAGFLIDRDPSLRTGRRLREDIYDAMWKSVEGQDAWAIWPSAQLPRSKGRIMLKSANIEDAPLIDPKLLTVDSDVEVLLEGVKLAIEISKSRAFQQYGTRLHTGKVPACQSFQFGSDDYWRCAIRHLTITFNHDMGTAKMGPATDPDAVVDPELRVHGIERLRVIDASIMPEMPVGHLQATTYMIAEKGADMIKRTWTKKRWH